MVLMVFKYLAGYVIMFKPHGEMQPSLLPQTFHLGSGPCPGCCLVTIHAVE